MPYQDYLVKSEHPNYGALSWTNDLYVRVDTVSQSIDTNQSTLKLGMYVVAPNDIAWSDFYGSYIGVGAYNNIAEQKQNFTQGVNGYGTIWLFSDYQVTVQHASDGTAVNVPILWKWGVNSPWGQYVIPSGTLNVTLTAIPRATTPTIGDVTMGSNATITLPRASSALTHNLTYAFGEATGTIATGAGASATWAVPLSLAAQVPNSTAGVGTIQCDTYNGTTLVGSKTIQFSASVPAYVVPAISSVSLTEATTGLAAKFNAFVQSKSTLAVAITAAGAQSSTIVAYETTILGVKYSGASFTSGTLTSSGTVAVAVSVTDSRGRTATHNTSVSVTAYSAPTIESMTASRITTAGVASDDGTRLKVAAKWSISPVGNANDHTFTVQYKKVGDASFSSVDSGSAPYSYNSSTNYTSAPDISVDYAYTVRLTITDYFGSVSADYEIPTSFSLLDFHNSGTGIAFGKAAETANRMDVNLPATFRGEVDVKGGSIELNKDGGLQNYGGFIDFHFNGSSDDYTSRIIEDASGKISIGAPNGVVTSNDAYILGNETVSGSLGVLGYTEVQALAPKGNIVMGGYQAQTGEQAIIFSNNPSSANPHNAGICGGAPNSPVDIALYDWLRSRSIFQYTGSENNGNGFIRLMGYIFSSVCDIKIGTNTSELPDHPGCDGFYIMLTSGSNIKVLVLGSDGTLRLGISGEPWWWFTK